MSLVIHSNKNISADEVSTENIITETHSTNSQIQTGYIAFWKFNNDGVDEGGRYELSDDNNITYDTGVFDESLLVNATTDYLKVANDEDLRFKGTDTFTFEFWLKLDSTDDGMFFGRQLSNTVAGYQILQVNDNIHVIFQSTNLNRFFYSSANGSLTTSWKHFIITYDGLNLDTSIKMYINGVLDVPSDIIRAGTGTIGMEGDATALFGIGDIYTATGSSADFYIDNLIVYDRVLTVEEAVAQYNGGTGIDSYASTDRIAYGFDSAGVLTTEKIYVKDMGIWI